MRILEAGHPALESPLREDVAADYAYTYPPRQAYRPVPERALDQAVVRSLRRAEPLNLYACVPIDRDVGNGLYGSGMAISAAGIIQDIEGGWTPPALDIPLRRQPLTALVEASALPHRRMVESLSEVDVIAIEAIRNLLDTADPVIAVRLAAGIATIHAALSGSRTNAWEALRWFVGSEAPSPSELEAITWDGASGDALAAMLPYVLDPFGLTTRRALIAGRACAVERGTRKATGTFYTPGDVARHLADRVIEKGSERIIDPACGAGVFLRAAFTRLCEWLPSRVAVEQLFGMDVEPAAVDASALVLVHDWLRREPLASRESPVDRFAVVRRNLRAGDALQFWADGAQFSLLEDSTTIHRQFPCQFDAVLMNPPFAGLGRPPANVVAAFQSVQAAAEPARVNMVWPFWELATKLAHGQGRVGVVLPLSVAYLTSPVARAGRRAVLADADWEFSFFDRTPDALFGDDVKQRVVLAVRGASGQPAVRTSALRRWSADRREEALARTKSVVRPPGEGIILKIGTEAEARAIDFLQGAGETLGDSWSSSRLVSPNLLDPSCGAVAVAPTAYNWIGVYRNTAIAASARASTAGQVAELRVESAATADALYAVLVSHILLWWWRATGDLFHVPLAWLRRAPFPLHRCAAANVDRLREAGRGCWEEALKTPVASTNRGVTLVSYRPVEDSLALARADDAVGRAFGLDEGFVRFTRDDARRLRIAGRND